MSTCLVALPVRSGRLLRAAVFPRPIARALGLLLALAACTRAPAQPATLLYDSFSGSGSTTLIGSTADLGGTWVGTVAEVPWMADGSTIAGHNQTDNAWLAFTPSSGQIYTLSLQVSMQEVTQFGSFAMGFANNDNHEGFGSPNTAAYAWIDVPSDRRFMTTNAGPATFDSNYPGNIVPASGDLAFKIVLDTTGADWTASYFLNGTEFYQDTYSSGNPDIHYVGIERTGDVNVTVDNLTLTTNIPEPATAALGAALAAAVFAGVRRRRLRPPLPASPA